ncbi:hypothetical protein K491DRAFT_765615 [Lophiostoma macrostomum CBS 122681]|uniref:Uncharacterized protein n=1 Tax=Lophiostoma macrostomum CBS 122681 TaxID=1314788 RepID=A0A6A6TNG9_9PLEO|nr:hypothetical protein K491DRAFT_765615 [Lophiostoma macrostomum CBS 122681]
MLSLPLIPPRPDASLWPSHRNTAYLDTSSSDSPNNPASHNGHRRPTSHHGHHGPSSRSYLATLAADENVIYQRKQHIRRFGAGWIRPPGVAKTYQATMDEAVEKEEQEHQARREQVMMDMAAAQAEAQAGAANQEAAAEGGDEEMEGEVDLDAEVPEAEADESNVSGSEDEASEAEEGDTSAVGDQTGMTFNEDSFIEGGTEVEHMLEMEEAEMAGVLQDERDLDDDVPEAGSYEHTDTELDSSEEEVDDSLVSAPSARRRQSGQSRRSSGARIGRGQRHSGLFEGTQRNSGILDAGVGAGRSSFGMDGSSSILDGSSFLRSSPAAPRGSLRSRFLGARGSRAN